MPSSSRSPSGWSRANRALECESGECAATVKAGKLYVKGAAGTEVTSGAMTVTTDGKQSRCWPYRIPANLDLKSLDSKSKVDISVIFKPKDGEKLEGSLTLSQEDVIAAIGNRLVEVPKGGVAFAGDDAAPAKPRLLAHVRGWSSVDFYGSAGGVNAVDLVAVSKETTRTGFCTGYTSKQSGLRASLKTLLHDQDITVYDRRTGTVKQKKSFMAFDPVCPDKATEGSIVDSYVQSNELEKYFSSLL